MDGLLGILIGVAIVGAALLAVPVSLILLWSRVRGLRERVDALEAQLAGVRERRGVQALRGVPEVPSAAATRASAEGSLGARDAEIPVSAALATPAPAAAPQTPLAPQAPLAPRAPQTPPAPQVPLAPPVARAPESLETMIGARWLLYIGVIAIVIGVAYFEKLAIDKGWIGETARVIQGAVVGFGLMAGGIQLARRGQRGYGQILAGGGGAILYLSTYAAFTLYSLIERPVAFALMVAITVLIAWLSDRQRSQGLALFAVGGGFVTPFLLPGTTDAQIALFTYDAILIAGTAALSHRRDWPFLNLVSYLLTLLTVAAWADRFYRQEKYFRTEAYLTLYCAMFLYIPRGCREKASDAAKMAVLILWTAPAAYYFASLLVLAPHDVALLVWLVALMLAGAVAASRVGPVAGLATWMAVAAPLVVWCVAPAAGGMRKEGLITLTAVYAIALLAELESTVFRDEPRDVRVADIVWVHLNALVMYAGAYVLVSPVSYAAAGYLAAAFAAWQAILGVGLWARRRDLAVHFVAVGFTLGAIAIALLFQGAAVTVGWAVEGAAVITVAMRQRLPWMRLAGVCLFAVAVAQTIGLLSVPAPASHVVFLNTRAACAALVVALCYALAWLDWRDPTIPERQLGMGAALLTAQFVTLALLTSEINAYWAIRNGRLERELTLSVVWGLYGTALVVVGLARDYAPIRYFAIAVLAITIGKVFFVDMSELDRIYRVGSVIVLGVLLLVTSYLYSRARKAD